MKQIEFGSTRLSSVVETSEPMLDPSEIFPDFDPQMAKDSIPWFGPRFYDATANKIVIAVQSFVIQMDGLNILVDTCVGDHKQRERALFNDASWHWLDKLERAGFRPEDIDMVVCSHLHVDHVGWNTRLRNGRWVPTFPNARYLMSKPELDYWKSDAGKASMMRTGDYVADSILPVIDSGQADIVDPDKSLNDKVRFEHTPGHTPGHIAVHLEDGGEHVVLSGDVMHHPLQLRFPDWSTRYCADQDTARATRKRFLSEWADTATMVAPAHFPAPTGGTICRCGEYFGFRFAGETETLT